MKKASTLTITFIFFTSLCHINAQTEGSIKDSNDDKVYKTIKIGEQVWMAENLAYEDTEGCWAYNNEESNVSKYGYLYNWEIAKYVCPRGWHLPTKEEFETLLNNYGGIDKTFEDFKSYDKERENASALMPDGESGFSAVLGGYRDTYGKFVSKDYYGCFWTATSEGYHYGWYLRLYNGGSLTDLVKGNLNMGYSVRCVMDKGYKEVIHTFEDDSLKLNGYLGLLSIDADFASKLIILNTDHSIFTKFEFGSKKRYFECLDSLSSIFNLFYYQTELGKRIIFNSNINKDFYEIKTSSGETKLISRESKYCRFQTWPEFLLSGQYYTITDIDSKDKFVVFKNPSDSEKGVITDFKSKEITVKEIRNNWLRFKATDWEDKTYEKRGWIKWRTNDKILIRIIYAW